MYQALSMSWSKQLAHCLSSSKQAFTAKSLRIAFSPVDQRGTTLIIIYIAVLWFSSNLQCVYIYIQPTKRMVSKTSNQFQPAGLAIFQCRQTLDSLLRRHTWKMQLSQCKSHASDIPSRGTAFAASW